MQRVEHVEEVVPRRAFAGWVRRWKVLHHGCILGELREECRDAQLRVLRHLDLLHLRLLEEVLLACEDLPQEVFVDHGLVWQVELEATLKGEMIDNGNSKFWLSEKPFRALTAGRGK